MKSQDILNRISKEHFGKVFKSQYNAWKTGAYGRSQEVLKSKIGVSRITISNWLNGKYKPERGEHLEKICEVFRMNPEDFLPKSPMDIMLHDNQYMERYTEELKSDMTSLGIDQHFFQFVISNFTLPRELSDDPFSLGYDHPITSRDTTSVKSAYTLPEGSLYGFIDQKDLNIISDIQKKVNRLISKEFTAMSLKFEKKHLKEVLSWPFVPQDEKTFNDIVNVLISACPNIDPAAIIKSMEDKANMKYHNNNMSESAKVADKNRKEKNNEKRTNKGNKKTK